MGWYTNAKTQREAKKFSDSVVPGRTYYSIEENHAGYPAPNQLLKEWVFTKRSRLTGQPMCGHLTAAGVYLTAGPISDTRPPKLMTFKEWSKYEVAGPNPADAIQQRDKSRAGR
jgi:hypothetical protein